MFGDIEPWMLCQRGPTPFNELKRRVLRKWRRVPDLEALRGRGMSLGDGIILMHNVFLDDGCPWLLSLGDRVEISFNVTVLTHDASTMLGTGYTRIAPVSIGSRVFIGANVTILPGVTIGDDVVIGAGSVVARDIPSGSVAAGSPARVLMPLEAWLDSERDRIARSPRWSAQEIAAMIGDASARGPVTAEALRARGGQGYLGGTRLN